MAEWPREAPTLTCYMVWNICVGRLTLPSLCSASLICLYPSLKCFYALKKVFIPAISVTAYCASVISCNLFLYSSLIVLFFLFFSCISCWSSCVNPVFSFCLNLLFDPSLEGSLFLFLFGVYFNSVDNIKGYFPASQSFFIQPPNSLHIFILYLYCIIYNRIINYHSYHLANVPHCPLARRSEQWEF